MKIRTIEVRDRYPWMDKFKTDAWDEPYARVRYHAHVNGNKKHCGRGLSPGMAIHKACRTVGEKVPGDVEILYVNGAAESK